MWSLDDSSIDLSWSGYWKLGIAKCMWSLEYVSIDIYRGQDTRNYRDYEKYVIRSLDVSSIDISWSGYWKLVITMTLF